MFGSLNMNSAHICNSFWWLLQKTDIPKAKPPLTDVQVYQVETDVCWPVFCPQISDVSYHFWTTTPEWESSTLRRMKCLQVANLPSNLWQDGLDERNPPISVAMLVLLTWSWPESIENPSISWTTPLGSQKKICIVAVSQYAIRIQLYIYIYRCYIVYI